MGKIRRNYLGRVKNFFIVLGARGGRMAMNTKLEFRLSGIGLIFANKFFR